MTTLKITKKRLVQITKRKSKCGCYGQFFPISKKIGLKRIFIMNIDSSLKKCADEIRYIADEIVASKYLSKSCPQYVPKFYGYKVYEHDKEIYCVMFMEKLKRTLSNRKFHYTYQNEIELILEKIEKIGVRHEDVHNENVMLDNKNKIKIIDFGLSYFSKNIRKLNKLSKNVQNDIKTQIKQIQKELK